jgi:hypothetical protein
MQNPPKTLYPLYIKPAVPSSPPEDPLKMKINVNTNTYYKKIYDKYNEKKYKLKNQPDSPV